MLWPTGKPASPFKLFFLQKDKILYAFCKGYNLAVFDL